MKVIEQVEKTRWYFKKQFYSNRFFSFFWFSINKKTIIINRLSKYKAGGLIGGDKYFGKNS